MWSRWPSSHSVTNASTDSVRGGGSGWLCCLACWKSISFCLTSSSVLAKNVRRLPSGRTSAQRHLPLSGPLLTSHTVPSPLALLGRDCVDDAGFDCVDRVRDCVLGILGDSTSWGVRPRGDL